MFLLLINFKFLKYRYWVSDSVCGGIIIVKIIKINNILLFLNFSFENV